MTDKPISLRLADALEGDSVSPLAQVAAAELRRLHAENIAAVSSFLSVDNERIKLRAQRDELLEALVSFTKSDYIKQQHPKRFAKALAVITKVEEQK